MKAQRLAILVAFATATVIAGMIEVAEGAPVESRWRWPWSHSDADHHMQRDHPHSDHHLDSSRYEDGRPRSRSREILDERDRDRNRDRESERDRDRDRNRDRDRDSNRDRDRVSNRDRDRDSTRPRPSNRDRTDDDDPPRSRERDDGRLRDSNGSLIKTIAGQKPAGDTGPSKDTLDTKMPKGGVIDRKKDGGADDDPVAPLSGAGKQVGENTNRGGSGALIAL